MTSSLMNRYYKGSAIEYDEQNAVKNGKTKIRNLFYCQNNSHYKQTVLYYILLIGHIESNPGPNIVSGKHNLKNDSLKIAHINACSLLPKIDLIELEMSNNDIRNTFKSGYSLFRASRYFGQRIISLVIEAVKHSPFYI